MERTNCEKCQNVSNGIVLCIPQIKYQRFLELVGNLVEVKVRNRGFVGFVWTSRDKKIRADHLYKLNVLNKMKPYVFGIELLRIN